MLRRLTACLVVTLLASLAHAQTPQPFPRPGAPPPPAPTPAAPAAPRDTGQPPPQALEDPDAPTAATLGVPLYPTARFLGSYDAGRGQRYYIFGTIAVFADIVGYYQSQLGERGDLVFSEPGTHMFTGGPLVRYRDETMAFPPSVTVKDWTSGGSLGYPNPTVGAEPARFPTVIMIVTPPPGAER
jgi:hypothetical protein